MKKRKERTRTNYAQTVKYGIASNDYAIKLDNDLKQTLKKIRSQEANERT